MIASLFALGRAVVERVLALLVGHGVDLADSRLPAGIGLAVWAFVYSAYPLATSGRTLGMSILGLRAVHADGGVLSTWGAVIRVLTFPLSFLLFGLGFVLILVRRDHRALHDLLSGAAVVYASPRARRTPRLPRARCPGP